MTRLILSIGLLIFLMNVTSGQSHSEEAAQKNIYSFSLAGSIYQPTGNSEYNSYHSSNSSLDACFDYKRFIGSKFTLMSGLEFTDRYNLYPEDSLKLKLLERFVQIPLMLGLDTQSENGLMDCSVEVGPYLNILLIQKVLHPDNTILPTFLKEKYSSFSYFKWGLVAQFTGTFYFKIDKTANQKLGFFIGGRYFGEVEHSSFGKVTEIVYTPAYSGMSILFGTALKF